MLCSIHNPTIEVQVERAHADSWLSKSEINGTQKNKSTKKLLSNNQAMFSEPNWPVQNLGRNCDY